MAQYFDNSNKITYIDKESGRLVEEDPKDLDYLRERCIERYPDNQEVLDHVDTWGYMALDASNSNGYNGFITKESIDECKLAYLRDPPMIENYKEEEDIYLCQEDACKHNHKTMPEVQGAKDGEDGSHQLYFKDEHGHNTNREINEILDDATFNQLIDRYTELQEDAELVGNLDMALYYEKKIKQAQYCKSKQLHLCTMNLHEGIYRFNDFIYVPNQGIGDCLWVAIINYLHMEKNKNHEGRPISITNKDKGPPEAYKRLQKMAHKLRLRTVKWIRHHNDKRYSSSMGWLTFKQFIELDAHSIPELQEVEQGILFERYLRYMSNNTSWGGQSELYALSHLLNRTIIVLVVGNDREQGRYTPSISNIIPGTDPIYLFNDAVYVKGSERAASHFEALFPIEKGVPIGFEGSKPRIDVKRRSKDHKRKSDDHKLKSDEQKSKSGDKSWDCDACTFSNDLDDEKCKMCLSHIHGEKNTSQLYMMLSKIGIDESLILDAIIKSDYNKDNNIFEIALALDNKHQEKAAECSNKVLIKKGIHNFTECNGRRSIKKAHRLTRNDLLGIAKTCKLNIPSNISKQDLCKKLFK